MNALFLESGFSLLLEDGASALLLEAPASGQFLRVSMDGGTGAMNGGTN